MRFAIQVEQCGEANLTAKSGKGQHHHPGLGHWGDQRTSMAHKESRFGVLEATIDIEIIENFPTDHGDVGSFGRKIRSLTFNQLIPKKY